jgi:putative effector of murein hydrolase
MAYEKKHQPLASNRTFRNRMVWNVLFGVLLLTLGLSLGVIGYHHYCGYSWVDSLLNASMILSGMGPMNPINNDAGKVFASCYAIFSGVVFVATIGVIIAPLLHRAMHYLMMEED